MKNYLMLSLLVLILIFFHHCSASPGVLNPKLSLFTASFNRDALYGRKISDSSASERLHYANKTPLKAFVIGFGPGFLIHGLGHFYAGDNKAGSWLLGSEIASIILVYAAAAGAASHMDCPDCNNTGIGLAGYSGLILFFGGWIYDYADAPSQIAKKKALFIDQHGLSLSSKSDMIFLKLSLGIF